jgi:hypothetical protein
MKIRKYSDLHLDHYFSHWHETRSADIAFGDQVMWYPPELPDDKNTILLLAGDLGIGSDWINYHGFSWINRVANKFKAVYVIAGNHCVWPQGKMSIHNYKEKCTNKLRDLGIYNVHILDCDTIDLGEYLLVGCTLWTDMDKGNPLAMHNMSSFMSYDGKITYWTGPNGGWERFTSQKWVDLHYKHKKYIKTIVEQNRDRKIIVMTHHIPVLGVGDPIYANDSSNAYYASDLSNLILDNPHIKYWFWGHSHYCTEVQVGETLLVNNSVGYMSEHKEQYGDVVHKVFDI